MDKVAVAPHEPFEIDHTVDLGPVSHHDVLLSLAWSNVAYEVDVKPTPAVPSGVRNILRGVSGVALGGRLLAIMGPSGCGKTTLLNCISGRSQTDTEHRLEGDIVVNDIRFTSKFRRLVSFVSQDDIVFENDTPREALYFNVRVKTGMSPEECTRRVDSTIAQLGIEQCADTVIGTPGMIRGVSGGERKRTNIGAELITNPRVLMLDEPTTGLDSVTALNVLKYLKSIAVDQRRTVMCTIHQPSSEIYDVFDDLMLMSQGRVVYHGPADKAAHYFADFGHVLPPRYNPADFFMRILQGDAEGVNALCDAWEKRCRDGEYQKENPSIRIPPVVRDAIDPTSSNETDVALALYSKEIGSSYAVQSQELLRRSLRNFMRSPIAMHARMAQTIFMSLLLGFLYIYLGSNQAGVQDTIGFIFMIVVNQSMLSIFNGVIVFPPERAVFLREQANGAYNPYVYGAMKILAELPMQIFFPGLIAIIVYWMTSLRHDASAFFIFFGTIILVANTAQSFGLFLAAAIERLETAMAIIPMTVLPFMLAGGLLANSGRLDPGFLWLNYLSFIRYAFILLVVNQYGDNHVLYCDPGEVCHYNTGNDVLNYLGFQSETMYKQALCLLAIMVGLRILTVWSLGWQAKKKRSM